MTYAMAQAVVALCLLFALALAWCGFRVWDRIERRRRSKSEPIPITQIG